MINTIRMGNKALTFKDSVFVTLHYVYTSLLANQPTPAKVHWPRKSRKPKLFKGHRP